MNHVQVLAAFSTDEERRTVHDAVAAVSVALETEILVHWVSAQADGPAFLRVAGASHVAFLSTAELNRSVGTGKLLYQVNPACQLIFYGDGEVPEDAIAYFSSLFPARPIGYLRILSKENVQQILRIMIRNFCEAEQFTWEAKRMRYCIPYHQILYFQSDRNTVRIHLVGGGEYTFTAKLSTVEKKAPPGVFLRVHQSFLVNRAAIRIVDKSGRSVILSNREEIPVSRAHEKEVL